MKTEPNDYANDCTKREFFAVTALQGILANAEHKEIYMEHLAFHAEYAVAAADALIAELNK